MKGGKKMKKLVLISLLGIFAVSLVIAGYVYNNFVMQVDVIEPFSVQYAIVGDAGNWNGETTCQEYQGEWTTYENGQTIDMQGLFAGEGRLACAKISNLAEADVDYTFSYSIAEGDNHDLCVNAFGENSISGTAIASGDTLAGIPIIVSDGAEPVQDCLIHIEASRG
jgi:hypothetical protein